MASDAQAQAELDAEAGRLRTRFGLGESAGSWYQKSYLGRVLLGWVLLGVDALAFAGYLQVMRGHEGMAGGGGELLIILAAGVAMVATPPRARRTRLYLFEAGAVRASNRGRRLSVLPWASLESVSLTVVDGDDHAYVSDCVLRGQAGAIMALSRRDSGRGRAAVMAAAQEVIAGRLATALTRQLDAGQPVTIGFLTVDQSGISSRGPGQAGGRWHVPWHQVRTVHAAAHGQRVLVTTGRWGNGKRAALDNIPNSFLARHVLEHAARQAGVSFTAA